MPFLARKAFISAAAAWAVLASRKGAWAAEQRVNNVLVEDGHWLLPGWESLTDPDDAGVAKTLDLVSETAKILAGKGIGLLLASIPFKARYCAELAAGSLAPAVVSRYARSLDAMQARGLKTVDLEAAMQPLQTAGGPAYYPTDQHWRWPSVDLAGNALATVLRANWTLPERGKRAPLPPLLTEQRVGDLATLLPPVLRSQMGLESYELRTAYGADLNGYDEYTGSTTPQPKDPPPVQLVGSSFVRPMFGSPQKLADALGTDVGLTFFNGDAGPYHALLMNLRSTLPKRAPAVVVWQMTEGYLHLGPAATGWWNITSLMSPDFFLSHVESAVNA